MNILVIGGNRYFGKRLVSKLIAEGHKVTLMNRGQASDDFGTSVNRMVLDRKTLGGNSLGSASWDLVYDQVCYDAREAAGACKAFEGRVKRYVFVSSQSVYGPGANISESTFDPTFYRFKSIASKDADYSEAKRQAEATFFQQARFPLVAVRFPIVIGEDDYTERFKFHVDRIRAKAPIYFPNVDAKLSLINSADAAEFLFRIGKVDFQGPINCCSREPIAIRTILDVIEKRTGQSANLVGDATKGEISPYGIEADWWMSIKGLIPFGFEPAPIEPQITTLTDYFLNSNES